LEKRQLNTRTRIFKALKSGRPVLVDFGSNSCIPCRQLRPILQEIRKEQAGKVEVLVIDVYKYQDLAAEYRIQVIPTIILFDSNAKEVFRNQGFMPKAAIMEQTRKVGVS
jgi:thioredoxin 1